MPATIDAPTAKAPDVFKPVILEDWEAEKALRAEERAKKRPVLRKCLDPEVAADYEQQKPKYEYRVSCTYARPNDRGRLEQHTETHNITAQNEKDAWALFCDKIQTWPSPSACVDRTIEKLKKI
jgi:hypothetical protein